MCLFACGFSAESCYYCCVIRGFCDCGVLGWSLLRSVRRNTHGGGREGGLSVECRRVFSAPDAPHSQANNEIKTTRTRMKTDERGVTSSRSNYALLLSLGPLDLSRTENRNHALCGACEQQPRTMETSVELFGLLRPCALNYLSTSVPPPHPRPPRLNTRLHAHVAFCGTCVWFLVFPPPPPHPPSP